MRCNRCQTPRVKLFGLTLRESTGRTHHEWCRGCVLEWLRTIPEVRLDLDRASLIELLTKG